MTPSWRLLIVLAVSATPLRAQTAVPSAADQIAAAVLPLPTVLRDGAGVRGYDAKGGLVILRPGSNNMICTGDRPGDGEFDVRCYERQFLQVIDRRRALTRGGLALGATDPRFEREIKAGRLRLPQGPTAGYRMLGPIDGYDPATRTYTAAIERWQSVHFPYRTAEQLGLPVDRESTMPYVMASGTWWAHVMIQHTPPAAEATADAATRLGTVTFPNSGGAPAQPDFVKGVLYLHSFEYEAAAAAFRDAQRKDPAFVMAYWGEAMTRTHPIWNEQDLAAAQAVLARLGPTREARAAKAPTPRERAWLDAVEVLYGTGSKEHRDTLYAAAMTDLVARYPDDEAHTFHSLAVMGLNQGVRDVAAYMVAGAEALEVFTRQPDHPGAAHYVIHAFDDPTHAPLGLTAARAYSAIAPGAAHAQHMTTHIFLALGMWPEVIAQNTVASGPDRAKWQAGHYTYWLHYALLQAGRAGEAGALLAELRSQLGDNASASRRMHLALARAQQVISTERWDDPSLGWVINLAGTGPTGRAVDAFARGYAAVRSGDLGRASAVLVEAKGIGSGPGLAAVPALLAEELEAALARAAGKPTEAERILREVAEASTALPSEFGPPDFVKPPYELLGEWLLEDNRPREAKTVFARSLVLMPGRLSSVRGLARAETRVAAAQ